MPFDKPTEASLSRANITKSELESRLDSSPGFSTTLMQIPSKLFKRARSMQSTDVPKRHSTSLSEPRMQRSFLFSSRFKQHENDGVAKRKVSPTPPSPELRAFAQRCDDVIQRTQQLLERTRAQELLIEKAMQTHMSMSPAKTPGKKHEHENTTPSKQSWFSKAISPWKGTSPVHVNIIVEGEVTEGVVLPHDTFASAPPTITSTSLLEEPSSQDHATTRTSKNMENKTEVQEHQDVSNDKSEDRATRKSSKGRGSRGSGRRSSTMITVNETVLQTENVNTTINTSTSEMTYSVEGNHDDANTVSGETVQSTTNLEENVDARNASETEADKNVTDVCDESATPKKGWFDWYKQKMFQSPTPSAKNNNNNDEGDNIDETNEQNHYEEKNVNVQKGGNKNTDAEEEEDVTAVGDEHQKSVGATSKTGMQESTKTNSQNYEEEEQQEETIVESLTSSPLPTPVPTQEDNNNSTENESNALAESPSLFSRLRSSLQRLASYTTPSKHFNSESTDHFHSNNSESDDEGDRTKTKAVTHKTRTRNSRTPVQSSRNRSRSSRQSHTANKNRKSVHFVSADKLESVTPARKRVKSESVSSGSASREGSSSRNSTESSKKANSAIITKATKGNQSSASSPSTRNSQSRTPARGSITVPPAPPPSALKSPRLSGFSSARSSTHEPSTTADNPTSKDKAGKRSQQQQQQNVQNKDEQKSTTAKHALNAKIKTDINKNTQHSKLTANKNAKKSSTIQSVKVKGNTVEVKQTKHIAPTPTRPSTEHREMIMFIRENSIKKCLSEFNKSDLIHFLRAEGVANPSEELTKKELLAEARALANA